jgi:hypothetical protein
MATRVKRTRAGGIWTEARYNSFIKSALRAASMRWPPKNQVKKDARIERGVYRCVGYNRESHSVPATLPPLPGKKRRLDNALVDHIVPVVDPAGRDNTWDAIIRRMFCEPGGLQLLCKECHDKKTAEEREAARGSRKC